MEWQDWGTLILVAVCLWTFIPKHIRAAVRLGLAPATAALLDTLHEGASVARKVLTHAAYRGLLGVPVPDAVMVKQEEAADENKAAVTNDRTTFTAPLSPIVTPNNEYSDALSKVRFQERAKVAAELYRTGATTNLSKTICQVFSCSVQSASKPDSTYQQALREVNTHLGPQFRQDDGSTAPATRPVTGRRTAA